jgi:hypothetical protein
MEHLCKIMAPSRKILLAFYVRFVQRTCGIWLMH